MPVQSKKFLSECSGERLGLVIEALRAGGLVRMKVWGESMLPTLWPGDSLSIQGVGEAPLPGEIVLAVRDDRCFVHRLVGRNRDHPSQWITRGDALPHCDPPFERNHLVGRVTAAERDGKMREITRLTLFARGLGLLLCHSSLLRSAVLRFHSWQMARQNSMRPIAE